MISSSMGFIWTVSDGVKLLLPSKKVLIKFNKNSRNTKYYLVGKPTIRSNQFSNTNQVVVY